MVEDLVTGCETEKFARKVADRLAATTAGNTEISSLGNGDPGIALALLHAGETFDDDHYRDCAKAVLRRAATATAQSPLQSAGLYDGTAGFVWVLAEFARYEPRYLPSLRSLVTRLGKQVSALSLPDGRGTASRDYDTISGAAGQLAALLHAGQVIGDGPDAAVATLLGRLLYFTATGADGVPNWFCPPARYPRAAPWYHDQFPHGMFNLGFSHGLPGALAALCLAAVNDFSDDRVVERIHDLSQWLIQCRVDDGDGPFWPGALHAVPDSRLPDYQAPTAPGRAAWCYGAPGVAVALLSASAVTGDTAPRDLALAALDRVARTPDAERQVFAPTLCHGRAGLLACFHRAHLATGLPWLRRTTGDTLAQLCHQASDDHPYLFADEPRPDHIVHTPGLLEGAAGVLLALLGMLTPRAARWDEVLFLCPNEVAKR